MIYKDNTALLEALTSPVRDIGANVYIYNAEGTMKYMTSDDADLKNLKIERIGDNGKFFGFGICQKLTLTLIDTDRSFDIYDDYYITVLFEVNNSAYYCAPDFYIDSVTRDENTNELTVIAYDFIYAKAGAHTIAELNLEGYSAIGLLYAISDFFGVSLSGLDVDALEDIFTCEFPNGANYNGTETIREVLDDLAEVFKCIYFMTEANDLHLKVLKNRDDIDFTVNSDMYFTLKTGKRRTLDTVVYTTELGDNLSASLGVEDGVTQYVRSNPFWEAYEDKAAVVNGVISYNAGLYFDEITSCEWRGLFNLQVGDKLCFVGKDGSQHITYLINDTLVYDGGLKQTTSWSYIEDTQETASNPASLGEVLKQTYAKVDKVNKQIELVAVESASNSEKIASLELNSEGISAAVSELQKGVEDVNGSLTDVINKVEATITPEEVELAIKKEIDNGVNKVTTATGFTFNEDGLTVSKTDSEMKTTITEDGMVVYKNEEAVLTANNIGVDAVNLHATTYLIIGNNSRFEDYGENRTGCFWIGG